MGFGDKLLRYVKEVQFCLKVGVRPYDRARLIIGTLLFHLSNIRQPGALNKKLHQLKGDPYRVNINNVVQDLYLRPFSGDFFIFHEIYLDEPYYLPNYVCEGAKVIVDLGSNIGMTTLYFAGKAHNAKFYCVEPDPTNLDIL